MQLYRLIVEWLVICIFYLKISGLSLGSTTCRFLNLAMLSRHLRTLENHEKPKETLGVTIWKLPLALTACTYCTFTVYYNS